jgi:hypothetical protein
MNIRVLFPVVAVFILCFTLAAAVPHSNWFARFPQTEGVGSKKPAGPGPSEPLFHTEEVCVKVKVSIAPTVVGDLMLTGGLGRGKLGTAYSFRGAFQLGGKMGAGPATIAASVRGEARINANGCKNWKEVLDTWATGVMGATLDAKKAKVNAEQLKTLDERAHSLDARASTYASGSKSKTDKRAVAAAWSKKGAERAAARASGCVVQWEGSVVASLGVKAVYTCASRPVWMVSGGYFMSGQYKIGEATNTARGAGSTVSFNPSPSSTQAWLNVPRALRAAHYPSHFSLLLSVRLAASVRKGPAKQIVSASVSLPADAAVRTESLSLLYGPWRTQTYAL